MINVDYNPIPIQNRLAPVDLTPLLAFQFYQSIKLNFNQKKYDYHRDGLIVNTTQASLDKRKDKRFFYKASEKLLYQNRYVPLLVSNLYGNNKMWIGNILSREALINALLFRKYSNNVISSIETDIQKIVYSHGLRSVEELYSETSALNYINLLDNKIIHPLTASILLDLNKTKYIGNMEVESFDEDRNFFLHKLVKFIPEERYNICRHGEHIAKVIKDIVADI
jgi:hypothetical protein